MFQFTTLLASAGLTGSARAEPPPDRSVVVPPRPDAPPQVTYPKGAEGDASVVLILTVEKDGTVRAAEVEEGHEPFASAAKQAAATWRFEPATREGRPVAARIRFAVTFHGPVPAEELPPSPSTATPAPGGPKPAAKADAKATVVAAPEPIEVTIRAEKPPPSVSSLSRAEVRQLPGAFGDPFRALEVLPGVTPVVSGLPFFYVRGAPPGNVGYYLDGVRVPYLYHVGAGPSVVNPAMVERVDLYSGGYPAQYGRYAGAIVAAETTAPRDDWHGEGNIRIFDAGAVVEGGFAGGRGTALVGGRYSYTAALLSLISPEVGLDYRDYQARITFDLTPRDRISLFTFGAYDLLSQTTNDVKTILFGSEFYRVDTRYDHKLGALGNLRLGVTLGFDQTNFAGQLNSRDTLFGTRIELTQPLSPSVTVRAGADAQFDHYSAAPQPWADPEAPATKAFNALFPGRDDVVLGAFGAVAWKMDRRVELTPGVRFDLFRSEGASAAAVDGRVALRVDVTDRVRLLHALGLAHQPPSFILALPGIAVAGLQEGLQTSLQSSAGVEVDLPDATTASITFFDNVFLNMTDVLSMLPENDTTPMGVARAPRSLGSAYGMEVYLRRRLTRDVGGFVSYTLSRSTRTLGKVTFPSGFDRPHVLNAAVAGNLGRGFRVGTRLTMYSGAPLTAMFGSTRGNAPRDMGKVSRDPPSYRLDARLEKRWSFRASRWISFVVEMLNTTLHQEVVQGQKIGPVSIPSLGVEGGF
jgi:TonB family protein